MDIAVTGASGFIGRALAERLKSEGHSVHGVKLRESAALPRCDAVVHLAGEPVAQRWTEEAKRRVRESRVEGTRKLVDAIAAMAPRPSVLVSASAVGYYGDRGDEILDEGSAAGRGFLAEVCVEWEREADRAAAFGVRVVKPRIGLVLGRGGGALARMLPGFRLGVGGRLGSGRQWQSWIHIHDLAALISFAIAPGHLSGAVNATAPDPVRNEEFTRTLAHVLHRPAFTVAPGFVLKAMFGEMASVLLESQRALPRAAEAAGFRFHYPHLEGALRAIFA